MDPVSDAVRKDLEFVDATRGLSPELGWNDWKRWYGQYGGRVLFSFEYQGEVDEYVQYTGLKYNIVPPAVESHHRRALGSVLRDRDLCVFVVNRLGVKPRGFFAWISRQGLSSTVTHIQKFIDAGTGESRWGPLSTQET